MKLINGIKLSFANQVFVSLFLDVCPSIIDSWKNSPYSDLSFDRFILQLSEAAKCDKEKRSKTFKIMSKHVAKRAVIVVKLWQNDCTDLTFEEWCLAKNARVKGN